MNPTNSKEEELAALIYMIRCCYAHSLVLPKWEIRSQKYKIVYKVEKTEIDLRNVHGQDFLFESIGGLETFWRIQRVAKSMKMI